MNSSEFQKLIVQELIEHKIPIHTSSSDKEGVNFYTQDYSAINMILNAEMFDVHGGQIWITIPVPNLPEWKIQINIRTWDGVDFRNYSKEINSFSVSLLILHNWKTIGYYKFVDRDKKLKEVRKNIQYVKKIYLPHSQNHHYYPDEYFYRDYVYDWILLSKNCLEILSQYEHLQKYSEANTENARKRIYSKDIKPILKIHFDEYFSIR